jgi:hypothetical protein
MLKLDQILGHLIKFQMIIIFIEFLQFLIQFI